jgi:niacin transporter
METQMSLQVYFHYERERKRLKTKELVISALLLGLALAIPIYFGFLRIVIPPAFTATLASHVPVMLSIFISPLSAAIVGMGSTIGFFFAVSPVIGARALSHVFFGIAGAYLFKNGCKPLTVLLLVLPIHALFEGLVVVPFGVDWRAGLMTIGVGTVIHHLIDTAITLAIYYALVRSKKGEILTREKGFHS